MAADDDRLMIEPAAALLRGAALPEPADLGYADQSHLTRDFTATIGVPPSRYARDGGNV